jgi:pyruvate,water dikinase
MNQITIAQKDETIDLMSLVRSNLEPVERVQHVKNWPVLIDSRGKIIRGKREVTESEKKKGMFLGDPISPGIIRGRAKVLMNPYEKPVEAGEILVARFAEPSWTPLFIKTAGVILEVGSPMQHGAIIAREYGIPCVSGVDDVTKLFNDGDLLELDGSSGTVQVIHEECDMEVANGSS